MSEKVINALLCKNDINTAIKELEYYKTWLETCTSKCLLELGNEGVSVASANFSSAEYDGTNDVKVSIENRGEYVVAVVATGSATLFIEFGTGVKNPDSHPEAIAHRFKHGTYGHGLGKLKNGWDYTGEPGTHGIAVTTGERAGMVHTTGNIANMSMYNTVRELEQLFETIARRCYK